MNKLIKVLLVNIVIFAILALMSGMGMGLSFYIKMGSIFLWLAGIDLIIFFIVIGRYKETGKLFLLFFAILFLIGSSLCSNNMY